MRAGCAVERSAQALRDAARNLRRKEGITLGRCVIFVPYDACPDVFSEWSNYFVRAELTYPHNASTEVLMHTK